MLVWPHPLFLCESRERQRKGRGIDRGHEQPSGRPALRLHKAVQIHPLVAWSHHSPDPAAFAGPNPAQDRTQPDAVLILAPEFHPGFWIRLVQLVDLLGQFF